MTIVNGKRKFVRFASEVEVVPEVSYSTSEPDFVEANTHTEESLSVDHQEPLHQTNSGPLEPKRRRLSSTLDDVFSSLSTDRFDQEYGANKKPLPAQEEDDGMILPRKGCDFPFTNHFSITSSSNLSEIVMGILND